MYELNILLKEGGTPFYEQIYDFIVKEIRSGALPPATRMPSTRVLAANLGVSRSTSQAAYDQLVSEGYLEASPCRGYYIADMEWMSEVAAGEENRSGRLFPEAEPRNAGRPDEETEPIPLICDFSPRGIDLETFPYGIWRKLSRDVLSETGENFFNAGDSQGEPALRAALAAYLHSARGVNCSPDQIVVGAGNEYLLLLLSQFLEGERVIAMENPTYKQAYRVFERVGYEVLPMPMDASGMSVKKLQESRAQLAYVMPSHQYPTGAIMPIRRRMEMLAWANRKQGRYLIEDDYDSEFRYKGKPIPALQGVDPGEKVIYIGTFSRSVAPAIRISYMVLPKELLREYHRKCDFYASTVSRVDQQILARFLTEGHFERHLNKMRKRYRAKHDALLESLAPLTDRMEITGENAGIHLLLTSRKGWEEARMEEQARQAGVLVYGMSRNQIGEEMKKKPGTVILGYASCSMDEIRQGAEALVKAWN